MNRTIISIGDKIFFEGRKTPFRVCRHGRLNGEAAVDLIRPSDWTAFRRRGQAHVARTIAIADLVRCKSGWRERWRQLEIPGVMDQLATSRETNKG